MELRHLRYFIAVAEELHFGRAAAKLFIAQPPLSQQIQQLEKELGFPLFTRTSRNVELTYAGRIFLEEARETIAGIEKAVADARRASQGEVGRLSIGFVGTATFSVLPEALRRYREQYPEVSLRLRELVSARQAQALRERRIQVGFARPELTAPDIICEPLITEPFVAALPMRHRLAKEPEIAISDLAHDEFILFPRLPRPSYGDLLIRLCQDSGFQPNIVQEAAEIQTAISLVAGGLGVTLLPASAVNVHRQGVVFAALRSPAPVSSLSLVYRSGDDTPALQTFLKVVKTSVQ